MAELQFAATFDESCRILQSILDRGDLYAVEKYIRDPQEAEHITQITEGMRSRWSELWGIDLCLFGSYSTYPPRYVRLKEQYYVNSHVAGPSIGLRPVSSEAGCSIEPERSVHRGLLPDPGQGCFADARAAGADAGGVCGLCEAGEEVFGAVSAQGQRGAAVDRSGVAGAAGERTAVSVLARQALLGGQVVSGAATGAVAGAGQPEPTRQAKSIVYDPDRCS
jgi:hypothetical protein